MTEKVIGVFLVDDHAMFRQALAELIAGVPSLRVVGTCGDAMKVVDMVKNLHPDVTVLDVTMPGWNGLDICWELTRAAPDSAVLMLSMHHEEDCIVRALDRGASGYVLKESSAQELIEAVRVVASGGVYLGPDIPRSLLQKLGRGGEDPYDALTARQRQILQLVAESKTNRQIAETLQLSIKTVDVHRTRLMKKLGIHNQTSLVKYALRQGIVTL